MNHSHRCPVNLKARRDLITEAKALGLNLSATFEAALEVSVKSARIAKWQEENKEAFEAYDTYVEMNGVFSDGKRLF